MKLEVGKFYRDPQHRKVLCNAFRFDSKDNFYYYTINVVGTTEYFNLYEDAFSLTLFKEWQEPGQAVQETCFYQQQIDGLNEQDRKIIEKEEQEIGDLCV